MDQNVEVIEDFTFGKEYFQIIQIRSGQYAYRYYHNWYGYITFGDFNSVVEAKEAMFQYYKKKTEGVHNV